MDQYLRDPTGAAVVAGAVTMAYVYGRAKMNNEGPIKNSELMKPALFGGSARLFHRVEIFRVARDYD